jgi:hypothetical protein
MVGYVNSCKIITKMYLRKTEERMKKQAKQFQFPALLALISNCCPRYSKVITNIMKIGIIGCK